MIIFFNDFFANFSHDDPNPAVKNPDNECYCLKDEGFRCFKSGVTYMEPCKRELVRAFYIFWIMHPTKYLIIGCVIQIRKFQ